ncbi:hypothetical protein K435DRAFT_674379 [Dendrothele bispora CBS 962.96]|uniref:Urea carboxylase n=1 Tax=Dendrothele bispora (strain CBS 962.96) TaxID=1314807 RepID=A0A4S8LPL7_DENBC|nr:hypothetical protein K435DRAFT_674379 [Dendrothele bispora CBS 962.96]
MYKGQKLLVANRGEIAVRILRTAKVLGIPTVAIHTPSDALSPHVTLADEAVALTVDPTQSESSAYLSQSGASILEVCKSHSVTLVHPGYGFLSENAEFAEMIVNAGITWLGPRPDVIRDMGIKHEARKIAVNAGIPVVPGSEGCLESVEEALDVAGRVGFPMILKATAGGGGMGMVVCDTEEELKEKLQSTMDRAKTLFGDSRVFLERYFPSSRHIEVQVFGNGQGRVIHLGERECSVQRRHQKVLEESPSPFCLAHPGLKGRICTAAVRLCESIKYGSAGTVEFIVDENSAEFFFLEMNTRIQVEHPVTEAIHPGLDLIKLMIDQGVAERNDGTLPNLRQESYSAHSSLHAIEVRVYSENPFENFKPSPGLLQFVDLECENVPWLRVDGWVSTGTTITPFFDPLMCKLIVSGLSREEALERLEKVLGQAKIQGPPNNMEFLRTLLQDKIFRSGNANTKFLDSFKFVPRSFTVLSGGLESTVQDYPGRLTGLGIPRSGPMDSLAFQVANKLVGNPQTTEAIELIVVPNVDFELVFHSTSVVAVTGKDVDLRVDDTPVEIWSRFIVPLGGKLFIRAPTSHSSGLRNYLAIRGGFPNIPQYLGSKCTSMGLGGYQGRSLLSGDEVALGFCQPVGAEDRETLKISRELVPVYPSECTVHVLDGPHDDEEYITSGGISEFYGTSWRVSASSNRMGIRLEGLDEIKWARKNGGEGGSHPSNILDNGYTLGSLNINGDTPVILTNEGPDMGGYVCFCTVAIADMWKLGQLSPGQYVKFKRVSWQQARKLSRKHEEWLLNVMQNTTASISNLLMEELDETPRDPKLHVRSSTEPDCNVPRAVFRQAGEGTILVEYGPMTLDFNLRARIHALESVIKERKVPGIRSFCPCVRSTMCHFDPSVVSQEVVLKTLIDADAHLPSDMSNMEFPGRRITFPIVLNDSWSREAIAKYMKSTRNEAVYLPSNVEYLAKNNGLKGSDEALNKLVGSDWFVFGVGFYLACPFLVPIDPRCRLVGQKMNPSRTYTPRGAMGIAGVVAAIYPVESPGGYQLYGRTLPAWQTWGKGENFSQDRPWLLQPFDQVHFEPISEEEYTQLEKDFDGGRHTFKEEPVIFSMKDYTSFVTSLEEEIVSFKKRQAEAVAIEEQREEKLLQKWHSEKRSAGNQKEVDEGDGEANPRGSVSIYSPLMASVWKILASKGNVIQSAGDVLLILEAMKTEIPIKAGERNVGKTIVGFGKGVKEGSLVNPGDSLVLLG